MLEEYFWDGGDLILEWNEILKHVLGLIALKDIIN